MRRREHLGLLLLLATSAPGAARAEPRLVRYPNTNGMGRAGLGYRMLDLALACAGEPYRIELLPASANPQRVRALLEEGLADVVDFGSTPEFERRYAAVYLPIDRGLNGWRLLVIRRADREAFARISTVAELSRFVAGQGLGWPDADILQSAGLPVRSFPHLESLFRGLEAGRFDYLPLGMDEAHDLMRRYAADRAALEVAPRLAIVYPFGRLFFTRKDDTALHALIDAGLRKAFTSGQAQKLLAEDPGFAEAQRHPPTLKLQIDNPQRSAEFRAIPDAWFIR
ncbi:transporter substrate-binding domain-containing protein [Pelomonas sp. KK5]|uniref:transporter substrate-binding domain-containing protein n=1 Tax=Pelomonas sp. KK5 TaxID=1855730 RepID=UPI00097BBF74|nr:transporter substrate-binding domain-containing protein [Pelomonas sp. KK5]